MERQLLLFHPQRWSSHDNVMQTENAFSQESLYPTWALSVGLSAQTIAVGWKQACKKKQKQIREWPYKDGK